MKTNEWFRLCATAVLVLLLGLSLPAAAKKNDNFIGLDLATRPLFAGLNVPPNVMVAVDDSGSMDSELLFEADDGSLYWDYYGSGFSTNGAYNSPSTSNKALLKYVYLFPNGCNNNQRRGRRVYCNYYAVPPLPQFGYTRSPDYNAAYFDPTVDYKPWVSMEDSNKSKPERAWTDPIDGSDNTAFDLTQDVQNDDSYWMFVIGHDTVIPKGTEFSSGNNQWYVAPQDMQTNDYMSSDQRAAYIGIKYFPATFYLDAATALPADFGYNATPLSGQGPNGQTLKGYQIKSENFSSTAAYQDAIQNFANWFTYYRKRHLATRGGIVAAFNRIGGIRAGSCTINGRQPLTMRDMDDEAQRSAFYDGIFNINYAVGRGTPNRAGLQFLGQQLEQNDSIITSPCQRNFAILFTDGYNSGGPLSNVGNVDKDYGSPFADGYSNTIADVAMHYYKDLDTPDWPDNKLRTPEGCKQTPPDPSLNCEDDLHMVTFGVTLGQHGLIFNNDAYPKQNADPYANPPSWPNPGSGNYGIEQIDDLWHATVNTRGDLLNAKTPNEIANTFVAALEQILGEEGSASSVSVNSASLTANSTAYQASFISGAWSGKLKALPQNDTGDAFGEPIWEASEQLSDPEAEHFRAPDNRVILMSARDDCGNDKYSAAALRYISLPPGCPALTEAELDYVRGERSGERANGGEFRNRNSDILGDIVHSNPLYVGTPNRFRYPQQWDDFRTEGPDSNMPENSAIAYNNPNGTSFAQGQMANREPMIYVGANDGMLHGFAAETGEEKLAYVPGAVVDNLSKLTVQNYNHQYYVDGSPNSGDVVIDGKWRTVLVSGLRSGGQSVFALDITDPEDFSEADPGKTVLWEFTDNQLGNVYGQPTIVRLHNGKWAAIFGNGYNSEDERAQLFIVDIATGELIKHIDTGAGPSVYEGVGSNGLGPVFPVDLDGDFITDYVYAGDLYGNMWQFDLTGDNDEDWDVGHSGAPLFVATDAAGNRQPITAQPQVGVHPYGKAYGVMVYFGTGKYLESDDRRSDPDIQNSFYGIWDLDVFSFKEANNGDPLFKTDLKDEIPRSRLVEQRILEQRDSNNIAYRLVSDNAVQYQTEDNDSEGKRGWFMDLPKGQGEMAVTNGRIEGDTISFSTTIPNKESCRAGGSGFFMLLKSETGGRTGYPAFDLNGDKKFTSDGDTFNNGGEKITASGMGLDQGVPGEVTHQIDHRNDQAYYLIPASDGSIRRVYTPKPPDVRRSWHEIRR